MHSIEIKEIVLFSEMIKQLIETTKNSERRVVMSKKIKRRNNKNRRKSGRILLTTMIIITIFLSHTKWQQRKIILALEDKKEAIQLELNEVNKKINYIDNDLKDINNLEFIEKAAREKYKMIKPREIIYIVKK